MKTRFGDIKGIEVISGQIMSRVTPSKDSDEKEYEDIKVVVPKAILDGKIDINELADEKVKGMANSKRIVQEGDIVIKLSTPYDAAIVEKNVAGAMIPSFCAIIRNNSDVDTNYILAFINSSVCKEQFKASVAGNTLSILTIGKVEDVIIPIPDKKDQREIGEGYINTIEKLTILKRICELERMKIDSLIKEIQ